MVVSLSGHRDSWIAYYFADLLGLSLLLPFICNLLASCRAACQCHCRL